jgi:EAL domain-containing protein (putative c-di-GMP-specific phosphodiesterase class I)
MSAPNALIQGDQSLLDGLERLSRVPEDCRAAYISLSKLKAHNRSWIRLRIAAHMFAPLVAGYGSEVFLLSNSDLVVIGRGMPEHALEIQVERLRALFLTDPASRDMDNRSEDGFATLYDLEANGQSLRRRVDTLRQSQVDPWRVISRSRPVEDRPLSPRLLIQVADSLSRLDPRPLLQRQAVLRIEANQHGHVVYEEFFMALAEIRRQAAPDVDLGANRWLFQELCRLFDPHLLNGMAALGAGLPQEGIGVGVNLNLETILSPALDTLTAALPAHTRVFVEIRGVDAITNLDRLPEAAARLRQHGHALVFDSVDPRALAMLDPIHLDFDLLKLLWTPDLEDRDASWDGPHPLDMIQSLGSERVILSRVESEKALIWGLTHGLRLFQGFFVDRIIGATTMAGCPKRALCTLTQCVDRRRAAAGPIRAGCPNPPRLAAVTTVRALPRRLTEGGPGHG